MKVQPVLFASALLLMALGVAALFAPEEIARAAGMGRDVRVTALLQLFAGGCFALGFLDWMNRYATVGGIYGRPVVLANFAFFFISTTTLARYAPAAVGAAAWGATAVFGLFAALYAWLFFGGPRS